MGAPIDVTKISKSDSEIDVVLAALDETVDSKVKKKTRKRSCWLRGWISGRDQVHKHNLFLSFFITFKSKSAFVLYHPLFTVVFIAFV